MGVTKKIDGKTYVQNEGGDWYESESPMQKEGLSAKVINGVQYHKDENGDWYEGEIVKKKDGQPSKTGGQEKKPAGIPPTPSQSQSKSPKGEEKPSWQTSALNPLVGVKKAEERKAQEPIKFVPKTTPKKPSTLEESVIKDKEEKGSRLEYIVNGIFSGIGKLGSAASDVTMQILTKVLPDEAIGGTGTSAQNRESALKKWREEAEPEIRKATETLAGFNISEKNREKYDNEFFTSSARGLAESAPMMMGFKGSSLLLGGYDAGLQTINNTKLGNKLPEGTKTIFALSVGTANAVLEKIGIDKIFGKQSKTVATNIAIKTIGELVEKSSVPITTEVFEKALVANANNIKNKILKAGGKITEASVTEFLTGSTQEGANILAEKILNKSQKQQIFDPTDFGQTANRIIYAGAQESVGGGLMGTFSLPFSKTRNYINEKVSEAKSPEDIENLKNEIRTQALKQNVSENELNESLNIIDQYVKIHSSIPENVANKNKVAEKIIERNELNSKADEILNESQNLDPAFQDQKRQEAKLFKAKADEINDRISGNPIYKIGGLNVDREVFNNYLDSPAAKEADVELYVEQDDEMSSKLEKLGGVTAIDDELDVPFTTNAKEFTGQKVGEETQVEVPKQNEIEQLRAEEQAELDAKIPNAEQYRVDGKVDKTKLTNEEDIKAFDEVYNKYDKLITPLLKEGEVTQQKGESVGEIKSKKIEDVNIEPIDFENESENIDVYEASNTAEGIAKDNGVNILRGKDLRNVALDKKGNVIGGLWTEVDGNEFSFDVAVDKIAQGKGVGEKLVNAAIDEFNAQDYEGQLKYKIDVTNPVMEKLLSKYGFEVVDKIPGHTIMEHPTNNPKLKAELPKQEQIGVGEKVTQPKTSPTVVNVSNKTELSGLEDRTKTDKNKSAVLQSAKKAIATLKSVFPDMDIFIHEDGDAYNKTMEQLEGAQNSRGNFAFERDKNNIPTGKGRIDINLSNASETTVAHEVTHAVLLKAFGDSPATFKQFRDRISPILRADLNEELLKFEEMYAGQEVAPEEYLTQLSALLSKGAETVEYNPSTLRKIAAVINEFVAKITGGKFQPFKGEVDFKNFVDFLNQMAGAIEKGEAIQGVTEKINTSAEPNKTEVDTSSLTSKSSLIQDLGLQRIVGMNKRITQGVTIKDLGDVKSHLTFSDRLVTGKVSGKNYLGGILFAAATNRVWASFTKTRVTQIINGMPKNEDGYRYLMPALLTEGAHMSNKNMSNTAIKLVEDAISKGEISPTDADSRIRKALNRKGLEDFLKIYSDTIGENNVTSELVISAIDNAIVKSNSTFEDRNTFLESLLGKADIDLKKRFGGLPSYGVLANGLAEPITNGHDFGDILLVIRTKGDLIAVQPKEGDADYHESYPWVIRAVNPDGSIADVETLIFKNSYNAVNVFPEVTNKQGQKFTYKQYVDKYGDGAKSRYLGYMGARSAMSTSVTEKIAVGASAKSKVDKGKGFKPKPTVSELPTKITSKSQFEDEDIVSASVNVAPLYSTKVSNIEQAKQIYNSDFYQEYKKENERIAGLFNLKVDNQVDGIGGYEFSNGKAVREATTIVNVTGKFSDIVNYAATIGALAPEVQDATIAGMYVENGSKNHTADKIEFKIDNNDAALKAVADAGFDRAGFTLVDGEISFFNVLDYPTKDFDEKIDIFGKKYKEYGGKITNKEKRAVRSEYIDNARRRAIISTIEKSPLQYGQDREGIRDALATAKERNERYTTWKYLDKSESSKEYRNLRQKQFDLAAEGKSLSDTDASRIGELEKRLSKILSTTFKSESNIYDNAKLEVDAIAQDIAKLTEGGFRSEFPTKRPNRAAIKSVRWYDVQPNLLGDGARTNIIVNTDADADFLFNEIDKRFSSDLDRKERENTDLGYPKRLIEIRTKNGKTAEIQVITPQGYLAKDGMSRFPKDAKEKAQQSLQEVRNKLGWNIPEGVGHYLYEINRDLNIPKDLRDQAKEISNKYYDAFLNPDSKLSDSEFKKGISDFKQKVDNADKSKWDEGNTGEAPDSLNKYLNESPTSIISKSQLPEQVEATVKALEDVGENTRDKNRIATDAGLIIHAGESKIDKLDISKAKGGVRGIYGKGIYFSDSPDKAADYGGEFTFLDKSKLSVIDTRQKISKEFIDSIKEVSKKVEEEGSSVRALKYDMFADKLEAEINGERDIDMAWKNVRDRMQADQSDSWNALLKDLGYDTIKNGYEYVVFDADKGNAALVKDSNAYIAEAYHKGDNPQLTKSVNKALGVSELPKQKGVGEDKTEGGSIVSKSQKVYDETGFISVPSMIEIVKNNNPTYLGGVMEHIQDMGEKLRTGNVNSKDVAKSYLMAVSSIRSGDIGIEKFENSVGKKVDEVFLEPNNKIRTEGAMAFLLTTDEGKRFLKNIESGKIDEKDRAFISSAMKPFGMFGENESKYENIFGKPSEKQINLTNINEFNSLLKGGVKNESELFDAIVKLKGISQAKVGFVSNFLGIGTRGVIDAREIQGWLRGSVFQGERTAQEAEMEKQLTKSNKSLSPLQQEILNRMRAVGQAFNIDPLLSEYIGHHMIWDAVANEKTTHDGLYLAMTQNEADFNNKLNNIKSKSEKTKVDFGEGEEGKDNKKEFDKLTSTIPNSGEVTKYLSGETIEKYEGEKPRNEQEVIAQQLRPALERGVDIIEKAKELLGEEYVEKLLQYVETENLPPANKALIYVSLENEVAKQKLENPSEAAKISKMQDLVRAKSQAFLRSNSLAINMGRLRKFAEVGYDVNRLTDRFFSSRELEDKKKIEDALQTTADDINKEAERIITDEENIKAKVDEGVKEEIQKIYENLSTEKKKTVDKRLSVLEKIKQGLFSKYTFKSKPQLAEENIKSKSSVSNIIEEGYNKIFNAIKAGIEPSKAIGIGVDKIKENIEKTTGQAWADEAEFRKDMTEAFKAEGVMEGKTNEKSQDQILKEQQKKLEAEINRQLNIVLKLKEKLARYESGNLDETDVKEQLKDVPEIEELKQKVKEAQSNYNKKIAEDKKIQDNIEKLEAELERVRNRKEKTPKEKTSEVRQLSEEEANLASKIKEENEAWAKEKENTKKLESQYRALETERNRQLERVSILKEKLEALKRGEKPQKNAQEVKLDTPEIEGLKADIKKEEKRLAEAEAKKEKTIAERLAEAKARVKNQIQSIQEQIINKQRVQKGDKLKPDSELENLIRQRDALNSLLDKYVPKVDAYADERNLKAAKTKLENEILALNKQIQKGQKDKFEKKESKENSELDALRAEKEARQAILEALDPTPKLFIENTLIEQGFGRQINVKTKNVVEKRFVLDWKKLAGEEGSVDNIRERVESALRDKGYTDEQILRMQDAFVEEYNNLSQSIVEKALNEINARNKQATTPEQKSAVRKLVEMYNYGLFNEDPSAYETALAKTLGLTGISLENFERVRELGEVMSNLFNSNFEGKPLNESQLRSAIQVIEEKMRVILNSEAMQQGGTAFKLSEIVKEYMDASQRMMLNTVKQGIENPISGLLERFYSSIGYAGSIPEQLNAQQRKMARDIYKEMVLQKGMGYGNVGNAFISKGSLDAHIHNMSDSELVQGIMSVAMGKTILDAVDSAYKAKITQQKFTYNLIKILTKDRMVNGKLEKGMSKEEAKRYVAEKISGQSFEDAQDTAFDIIDKINFQAGKKILNDSPEFVSRLATDIVNAALVNGEKITSDMVTAAYNAAYKAAGRGLGHVANNIVSETINTQSGKLESRISDAIKQKKFGKATYLNFVSIFYRNIANPFVGGGTNWIVLKAEKTGLGLISGLVSKMVNKGAKMDLMTDTGMKELEDVMYSDMKTKDMFIRGAIGGIVTTLTFMLIKATGADDEYEKWIKKNPWAKKYLTILTPEIMLGMLAAKEERAYKKYVEATLNQNEAFDKGKMALKVIYAKDKATSAGVLLNSSIGNPIPWRLVRDGQQIWMGATGGEPYAVSPVTPKTFGEAFLKGGMFDYMGLAPTSEDKSTIVTKEEFDSPEYKIYKDKGVKMPAIGDKKQIRANNRPDGVMTDEEFAKYSELVKKYMKEGWRYFNEDGDRIKVESLTDILDTKFEKAEYKKAGREPRVHRVLGKDLTTEELQSKVNSLKQQASDKAKEELKLVKESKTIIRKPD